MSNKRTEEEKKRIKEKRKKRIIKRTEEEIKRLKLTIKDIKRENRKKLHIRNLKICKAACNFALPFVLTSSISTGIIYFIGGGLPIIKDAFPKYKIYNLNYETNNQVNIHDTYETKDNNLESSIIIYSPWKKEKDQYVRTKREYEIKDTSIEKLYQAVLENDYQYIEEHLQDYKEEIQYRNSLNIENNDYFLVADIHFQDMNDFIYASETDSNNALITIVDAIAAIILGHKINKWRNFNLQRKITIINDDYQQDILSTAYYEYRLEEAEEKLLVLKKKEEERI